MKRLVLLMLASTLVLAGCGSSSSSKDTDLDAALSELDNLRKDIDNQDYGVSETVVETTEAVATEALTTEVSTDAPTTEAVTVADTTESVVETTDTNIPDGDSSGNSDLESIEGVITIDGVEYGFPCTVKDFMNDGWTEGNVDPNTEVLEANHYGIGLTLQNPERYGTTYADESIRITPINDTDETLAMADCSVRSVEISNKHGGELMEKYAEVALPNGIKFGSTYDDIAAVWGDGEMTYENTDFQSKTYEWNSNPADVYDGIRYTLNISEADGLYNIKVDDMRTY